MQPEGDRGKKCDDQDDAQCNDPDLGIISAVKRNVFAITPGHDGHKSDDEKESENELSCTEHFAYIYGQR